MQAGQQHRADEGVVMHGNSRHSSPRAAPAGGRGAGASDADSERLAGLLEPAVAAMGMDLEGVRITSAGRRRLLRVVVDADGGVSLDDIALVSRELSARLDAVAAMGEAPYTLEVSSPGVDRPLTEPRHWRRAVGRLVTAPLSSQPKDETGPPGSPATIEGRITRASEHGVLIDVDGQTCEFGYAELGPGRIQIEFARLAAVPDGDAGEAADEEEPDGH
jgi:ribosome maturation factor RimP